MIEHFSGTATHEKQPQSVNLRCPKCGHRGVFASIIDADARWEDNSNYSPTRMEIGSRVCPNYDCRAYIFVVIEEYELVASYPPEVIDFDKTNLPENILSSFEEAVKCHGAGCFRAAALMVRRVLEELCDNKEAKGKDLNARISALSSTVVLPSELLQAAHELRILGNDAAHIEAKAYDGIEAEEIEVAIDLAKELLKAVYQYSNLVGRLRALKKPSS